jgi:hypothetical protein
MATDTLSGLLKDMRARGGSPGRSSFLNRPGGVSGVPPAEEGDDALAASVARAATATSPETAASIMRGHQQSYLRPLRAAPGEGGGPMSLAEMDSRARAMGVLDDFFGSEEELRPQDAMEAQIEAQRKTNELENLRPYGSTSRIEARYGSGLGPLSGTEIDIPDVTGEKVMGEPTRGEALTIERDRMKQTPDLLRAQADMAGAHADNTEATSTEARIKLAARLFQLRESYRQRVMAGDLSAEQAAKDFEREASELAVISDILKRGVPQRDPESEEAARQSRLMFERDQAAR